jgi:short subunit dehydrogenase-like uncharacterized protein
LEACLTTGTHYLDITGEIHHRRDHGFRVRHALR